MPFKYATLASVAFCILGIIPAVSAQTVRIQEIPNAEDIEVVAVADGAYILLAELGPIKFPLPATQQKNGSLQFTIGRKSYSVSRADVTLVNEKLVNDACGTIPSTLARDARSASVKGAGEGCK
ncbi:MAG TPA: hypothetical protein VL001_14480 [Candidimonas sp.]|nr:hypothetical protein [Candidimonas sp.]